MSWINIVIVIMVIILIILYFVIIPVARHKSNLKKREEMKNFFASLHEGEEVMLLSGVVGTIKHIDKNYVYLRVTDNTIIKVNKHGIASKIKNESN